MLKKYKVVFTDTSGLETTICAESEEEAKNKMDEMIRNGEIDLAKEVPVEQSYEAKEIINIKERMKMVRAMDTVIRNLNDEKFIMSWLTLGVEDHDDDLSDEDLEFYCEDTVFADLMRLFCSIMNKATNEDKKHNFHGTLYCDNILSKEEEL